MLSLRRHIVAPKLAAIAMIALSPAAAACGSTPHASASKAGEPRAATIAALDAARPFAPTSFWNARLSDSAPLDRRSKTWVTGLQQQVASVAPWINTTNFSTPVFTVGRDQATTKVHLDTRYGPLQDVLDAVPVPTGARAAAGTDQTTTIYQPSTDTLWEFWKFHREADGWHARWGGRIAGVSRSPGYYSGDERNWGATATSLPMIGGLIRIKEARAGVIDHALALVVIRARARSFVWPAQRTDGGVNDPDAIPEGARFRLDPKLDIAALHLPPLTAAMAYAAQRYGIVVRDAGGAVAFAGEDPLTRTDPWAGPNGIFRGRSRIDLVRQFPWSHLQALRSSATGP